MAEPAPWWRVAIGGLWPFKQIIAKREWRKRDRQETVVATAEFVTTVVDPTDRKPTGDSHVHLVVFLVDGNDVRYTRLESTESAFAKTHRDLLRAKAGWRYHGSLPDHAKRVDGPPRAKLVVFPGGASA